MKKNLLVSIAIFTRNISHDGFDLWTQVRQEEGPLFGFLEFPGGKIEAHETPLAAMVREVLEEVELEIHPESKPELFKLQSYQSETKNICLYVYRLDVHQNYDTILNNKGKWLNISYDKKSVPLSGIIPTINHVIIDELAVYLQKEYQLENI